MKTVFVFIPDTLQNDTVGMLEGFLKKSENNLAFYITSEKLSSTSLNNIGFYSENTPKNRIGNCSKENSEWIHINSITGAIKLNDLQSVVENDYKIIGITYNYNAFEKSDILQSEYQSYGDHFETLFKAIKQKRFRKSERNQHASTLPFIVYLFNSFFSIIVQLYFKVKPILLYSATAKLTEANIKTIMWVLRNLKEERRLTLKTGNIIIAKFMDICLGLLLLYVFWQQQQGILLFVEDSIESVVQSLKQLLNFLMGSPVGLKLNYAFNRTLGTFFLYHISLWRAFLHAVSPFLNKGFRLLTMPGAFGLSFQAALVSDLVAFSTFHVYCIYVYAARLYGLQLRGLVSLWRLFIGRKYNPLRERVDSYQYTHNQLFIGTLGFTVLLFLLPTTFLYYAVFTTLRVALKLLENFLHLLRYILQCLPAYVTLLWLINSPSVKGSILLTVNKEKTQSQVTLHATLRTLSLWTSIVNSLPDTIVLVSVISWGSLIRNIFTGTLL